MWLKTDKSYVNLTHVESIEIQGSRIKIIMVNGDMKSVALSSDEMRKLMNYFEEQSLN